eukprot:6196170-Pleurochrysis_carterae.AAC.6
MQVPFFVTHSILLILAFLTSGALALVYARINDGPNRSKSRFSFRFTISFCCGENRTTQQSGSGGADQLPGPRSLRVIRIQAYITTVGSKVARRAS